MSGRPTRADLAFLAAERVLIRGEAPSAVDPATVRAGVVARVLDTSTQTIKQWVAAGELPRLLYVTSQTQMFSLQDLAEWSRNRWRGKEDMRPRAIRLPQAGGQNPSPQRLPGRVS